MTPDLFKKDYRQLTAQGVKFTPEDIVRLNALAVKVSLSRNAASNAHLPRAAFLPRLGWWRGEIVLREPTVAHDLWIEQVSTYVDVYDERNFYFVHAYALSRPAEKLPDAFRARRVIRKVFTYAAKRLALYTSDQLSSAVDYVLFGADWKTGEHGPAKEDVENSGSVRKDDQDLHLHLESTPTSTVLGLIAESRAIRLPITLAEAMQMTASELAETIIIAKSKDGKFDEDASYNQAMGEYVRARNEIRKRNEKAATEASSESRQKTPPNESSTGGEIQ